MRWHDEPVCPHCGSISKHYYKLKQNGEYKGLHDGYVTTSTDGLNWTTPEQIKDESGKVVTAQFNGVCVMP